jgi:two-component system sensor histidine kinase DesK
VRANAKLQMAHEEIEQLAKLAERERIARDLHDVLGHTLSVIVLKSELAGRLFSRDPQRAAAEIADVEMISRTALTEVREAIRGYRAEGLAAEIKRAHSTLDAAGVTLVCEDKPPELTPAVESVVSLIVREAVTNIVRHAQASRCSMSFSAQNGHTSLVVEDDGRGGVRAEGNGLRGMRERIEALGGQFAVDGSRGTRLTILLPTDVHAPLDEAEMTS